MTRATAFPADLLETLQAAKPERFRPRVDLHVHLSDLSIAGLSAPVARVEGVGPLLADSQLFAGCRIRVTPVIDLNDRVALDCYEHPTGLATGSASASPATTSPTPPPSPAWPAPPTSTTPRPTTPTGHPARPAPTTPGRSADDITGGRHMRAISSRQCGRNRYVWRTPHRPPLPRRPHRHPPPRHATRRHALRRPARRRPLLRRPHLRTGLTRQPGSTARPVASLDACR